MELWVGCCILIGGAAYLSGSIPTGYLLGKVLKGVDIREHGSMSTGATNVLRTLGKTPALVTLFFDLLKGLAAVAFASWIFSLQAVVHLTPLGFDPEDSRAWAMTAAALLAVVGHSRSIWIRFAGGKSAATGLGVLLAMSWQVGLGVALIFTVILATSRIVSLSSISAAIAAVTLMAIFDQPTAFFVMSVAGSGYVILLHKSNIYRLLAGTEPRIGKMQPALTAKHD